MGITAKVVKHLLWSGKGAFCIHDPCGLKEGLDQCFKSAAATVDLSVSREDELSMEKSFFQLLQITLTKLLCQRLDSEQVRVSGRRPSGFVSRQRPAGNDAMQMEVVHERLAPCV